MEVDDLGLLQGRYWPDLWLDRPQVESALLNARQGILGRFSGLASTMKGNLRFWDVVVSPIMAEDGRPLRLLSISRDIRPSAGPRMHFAKARRASEPWPTPHP